MGFFERNIIVKELVFYLFIYLVIIWLEIKEGVIMWSLKEYVYYFLSRVGWIDLGNIEEVVLVERNVISFFNIEEII